MLRLLGRLLTALSLLALLAVLTCWTRAQWRQGHVVRRATTGDARALRHTVTDLHTATDGLYLARQEARYALTATPAAARLRRDEAASDGWLRGTRPPESLADLLPTSPTLGFAWQAEGPLVQKARPPGTTHRDPGWHTVEERYHFLAVPWWFLALCSAVLPTLSLRRHLRALRHRHGTCPQCGYDLRASPTRCPECGRVNDAAAQNLPSHS